MRFVPRPTPSINANGSSISLRAVLGQGPKGDQGDQGLPGVNAVPTDDAVATYATTDGTATKAALSASYVQFVRSDTGAPLPAGHVTVKVDPTTHEIVDIIWEA